MTVNEFRPIAVRCDPNISHWESTEKDGNYSIWHEFQRIGISGDSTEAEEAWRFQVDRFTRDEDDPMIRHIWETLLNEPRLTYPEHHVMYENASGYIHHVFQVRGV